MKRFAPAAFLILLASSPPSSAQDNVNVGAVLRYTGLPTNIQELKDTNVYLRVIESQVASSAIHLNKSRYIDRVSVDAIFNEKNLSEDQAFNVSSGALRGLLGRLDVLIVIDASDDDMARLKAIDLEDGSVRALENCKRGFLGGPSGGAPDCAKGFVLDLVPVIDEIFARKAKRRVDKQQADAANEASRAAQAKAAAAAQRTLDAKTEADTEAAKREQEAREQVLAQHQAEEAKELSERQAAIARLQPNLEGALARLGSANTFWGNMAKSLSERGQTLRSDVQTELRAANMEGQRCQESSRSLDVNSLKQCLAALPAKLDKLDEYK